MDHERAFREAIQEQPDDDLHRLAWADWLDDHGRIDQAAFVRAQLRAASLPEEDLARDDAEDEADDLLAVHEAEWAGRLRDRLLEWRWRRGCIEHATLWADTLLSEGKELFALAPIRSLRLLAEAPDLSRLAGCPFLQHVEDLDLSAGTSPDSLYKGTYHVDAALNHLLVSPHLTRLKRLTLRNQGIEGPLMQGLIDTGRLSPLVALDLYGNRALGDRALRRLAEAEAPHLERLNLIGTNVTLWGMQALLNSRGMPRLHDLEFNENTLFAGRPARSRPQAVLADSTIFSRLTSLTAPKSRMQLSEFETFLRALPAGQLRQLRSAGQTFTLEHIQALANSPNLTGLRSLLLWQATLSDSDAMVLAKSANVARLTQLDLRGNAIGGPGIRALVNSPRLTCLHELNLAGNYVGTANTAVIAASPCARRLTCLDLSDANLDAESAKILAGSPNLARLRILRLANNHLGDEGVGALVNSPHLRRLRELHLDSNGIDSPGAATLLESPYLERVVRLGLRNAMITPREREQLRVRFGQGAEF